MKIQINKNKLIVIAIVMMLFISTMLTGCSGSTVVRGETANTDNDVIETLDGSPVKLVILAFNGNNSARADYTSDNVTNWVEECTASYGQVAVINVDGNPDVVIKETFDIPEAYKETTDPKKLSSDAKRRARSFMEALESITPDDPEVDYLKALHLASRELAAAPDDTKKILIVLGSGISTTGTLNFQNNIIIGESEAIADMLEDVSAIPRLEGVTAVWMGLGDTASPQMELTYGQRDRLVEIWSAILTRGGAEFENPTDTSTNKPEDTTLPVVTTIEFPCDPTLTIRSIEEVEEEILDEIEPAIFNIEFIGDSSEYLDEDTTMQLLSEVADYMKRHPEYCPIVAGACAGDEESDYVFRLSQDRADAIKRSLISLGIEENRITTIGLGNIKDPYHIFGVGVEGPLASQNRKVIIVNKTSPEAEKLLNN